jgi:hypothetical protein
VIILREIDGQRIVTGNGHRRNRATNVLVNSFLAKLDILLERRKFFIYTRLLARRNNLSSPLHDTPPTGE